MTSLSVAIFIGIIGLVFGYWWGRICERHSAPAVDDIPPHGDGAWMDRRGE